MKKPIQKSSLPPDKIITNLAFFLLDKTGSIVKHWNGHLLAKEQRNLFGTFLGKGNIFINGADETIQHSVKVCFGTDWDVNFNKKWSEL